MAQLQTKDQADLGIQQYNTTDYWHETDEMEHHTKENLILKNIIWEI
jgi:hypothetical protein